MICMFILWYFVYLSFSLVQYLFNVGMYICYAILVFAAAIGNNVEISLAIYLR